MKILHYIPSIDLSSGGVGAYMQLLTKDLGNLCELHVVTHHSENELRLEGCTLHYIPYKWLPWNNCKKKFLDLLNDIHPDVFHTNCCWIPISALTAMWAKKAGYKVVYTPHGMLEPWIIKRNYWTKKLPAICIFQKRGIQCADLIHATADSEKTHLLQLGWNKNISIIGNCVDVHNIQIKQSWKRTHKILFLSRVHVKKGIHFLIEAVAKLNKELYEYEILIAGSGEKEYIDDLKSLANKLGIFEKIHFIGSIYGNEKFNYYRDADLFILPTYSENFGIVVPEALACGTPVITTHGAPWEDLENHHCGWWTEIGTEPLVNALKEFLQLPKEELEIMGKNGRKLVEKKYSCQMIAKQFIEMYEKV